MYVCSISPLEAKFLTSFRVLETFTTVLTLHTAYALLSVSLVSQQLISQ